jgi:glyoxylase-like metal-dependent hydrolase (beta-lactamase superfamily II)
MDESHYLLKGRDVFVKRFPTGLFQSNTYVVHVAKEGFIVDAGANDEAIFRYIARTGVTIRQIYITHSHVDHLAFGTLLKARTGGKLCMHEVELQHFKYYTPERIQSLMDEGQLKRSDLPTLRRFLETQLDVPLRGGEHFDLQGLDIDVLHTPGHSAGSICVLVAESLLFSGDTLFPRAFGRTDLDSGDQSQIYRSLRQLLTTMPDGVVLLPGHGNLSTIGEAKAYVGPRVFPAEDLTSRGAP